MKKVSTVIFFLWTINCFATGQTGELVIYKGDTLTMLCEPLETYLQQNEPREKLFPFLKDGCSTALWRGYVGLWEIRENRLLLIDLFACGEKSKSIKSKIFKGQTTEIFADWFNGELLIEKGKVIRYNHMAYDRHYETEFIVNVKKGLVESEKEYKNGVMPEDKRFSRDIKQINDEIYKRINWDIMPILSNKKRLYIPIILDNGKLLTVDSVIEKQKIEDSYKIEIKRIISEFPDVQVFYSRGLPFKESYYGYIVFSNDNRKRYAR